MPKYYTFEDKSFYQGFRDAPFALVFIFSARESFVWRHAPTSR